MASSFEFKRKSLENVIESLLCYKCKAVPGPAEKQKNRYVCIDYSHQLCEECKSECDCGSKVGKRPNPVVYQMLKDLPIYCPHYKTGCRQIFMEDKGGLISESFSPWLKSPKKMFQKLFIHLKKTSSG